MHKPRDASPKRRPTCATSTYTSVLKYMMENGYLELKDVCRLFNVSPALRPRENQKFVVKIEYNRYWHYSCDYGAMRVTKFTFNDYRYYSQCFLVEELNYRQLQFYRQLLARHQMIKMFLPVPATLTFCATGNLLVNILLALDYANKASELLAIMQLDVLDLLCGIALNGRSKILALFNKKFDWKGKEEILSDIVNNYPPYGSMELYAQSRRWTRVREGGILSIMDEIRRCFLIQSERFCDFLIAKLSEDPYREVYDTQRTSSPPLGYYVSLNRNPLLQEPLIKASDQWGYPKAKALCHWICGQTEKYIEPLAEEIQSWRFIANGQISIHKS